MSDKNFIMGPAIAGALEPLYLVMNISKIETLQL